ncbi:MAG: AMP-binding protein [Flavobacteriia bacterium]|nr:AMP-binding protein [Flavobacteriia bacterium]
MELNIIEALEKQIRYVLDKSPFYKKHFKIYQSIGETFSLELFHQLPFTEKSHIAESNDEFLCVSQNEIADFVCTSGTTGQPVSIYLTEKDLNRLAENECASFQMTGAVSNDVFQLMTTMDKKFMAGLAYYLGARKLKAGLLRLGPGNPALQWDSILRYNPTILIAVPTFILKCIEYARNNGIDINQSSVKKIICIGEPIRQENLSWNALGKRIIEQWNVQLFSTYASTEMGAAFTECEYGLGAHVNEKLLYLEVLDEDENPVQNGDSGEIIVSTLGVEGTPLIRFKTGDLAHIYYTPCECGRTSPRIGPIVGRKNQMIKFKGTTIFPAAIFEILDNFPEIKLYQIEVKKDNLEMDQLTILLEEEMEYHETMFLIYNALNDKLRVKPHYQFLPYEDLQKRIFPKEQRKAQKIMFC